MFARWSQMMAAATAMSSQRIAGCFGGSSSHTAAGNTAAEMMLPRETYPVSTDDHEPDRERDAERERCEREHDPCRGRDSLPTSKADEDRIDVTEHRHHPADQSEQLRGRSARREDEHRHQPLGHVEDPDGQRVLPAEHTVEVRGTEVPAAVLTQIDTDERVGR